MRERERRAAGFALALTAACGACTTTTVLHTNPEGAHLWVREQYVGRAPQPVTVNDGPLSANRVYVRAELEGYQPALVQLQQDPAAGWILLDTLFVLMTAGLAAPIYVANATVHRGSYRIELTPVPNAVVAPGVTAPWSEQVLPAEGVYPPPPRRELAPAPAPAPAPATGAP